jgi:hypothetical protein
LVGAALMKVTRPFALAFGDEQSRRSSVSPSGPIGRYVLDLEAAPIPVTTPNPHAHPRPTPRPDQRRRFCPKRPRHCGEFRFHAVLCRVQFIGEGSTRA